MDMDIDPNCERCGGRGSVRPEGLSETNLITRIPCGACIARYRARRCEECDAVLGADVVVARAYHQGVPNEDGMRLCSRACAESWCARLPVRRVDGDAAPTDLAAELATARRAIARLRWVLGNVRNGDALREVVTTAMMERRLSQAGFCREENSRWRSHDGHVTAWAGAHGQMHVHAIEAIAHVEHCEPASVLDEMLPEDGPWDAVVP